MIRIILTIIFISTIFLGQGLSGEPDTQSISVTTTDFQFSPPSWTVHSGEQVTLSMKNTGKEEHEWVILKKGTTVTIPFGDDDENKVFWEIEASPGKTNKETFTAPREPGTYDIVCGKPKHIEQGMKGTLIVQ